MPLPDNKNPSSPSVFQPAALLREARRQKRLATVDVPALCILDPDGDIVRQLRQTAQAQPFPNWPCYHTALDTFTLAGQTVGIVGCAVGAPFAVLIAEELFASGCQLLVSITSAGQITPADDFIFRHHRPRAATRVRVTTTRTIRIQPRRSGLVAMAVDAQEEKAARVGRLKLDHGLRHSAETAEAIEAARSRERAGGRDGGRRALRVRAGR